jgi:hypothetical protein
MNMVTVIKSIQKSSVEGQKDRVRYQVVDGSWDDSMEVPAASKLTTSFYKAFEYAAKIMGKAKKDTIKFVESENVLNEPIMKYNKDTKQLEKVG